MPSGTWTAERSTAKNAGRTYSPRTRSCPLGGSQCRPPAPHNQNPAATAATAATQHGRSPGQAQDTQKWRISPRRDFTWTEHGEALMRRRKEWYYRRQPRPGVSVIGDRLMELAFGGRG